MQRNFLNKPYYVFRPGQLVRRAGRALSHRGAAPAQFAEVRLPWGAQIRVRPDDEVGSSILRIGLFDLCVTEAIWRLIDPREIAVDIGANIGHMTSAMAVRVGTGGTVVAFEPHPEIFRELSSNAGRWSADRRWAEIRLHELALSDRHGSASLSTPADFAANRGAAALVKDADAAAAPGQVDEVRLARLDEILDADVGVMKIDVEGHELEVLAGAAALLRAGRVRDIVFEEWEPLPTRVTSFLQDEGYTLFSLDQALLGPVVGPAGTRSASRAHQAPSYIATREPARAFARLRKRGWAVLRTPLL